MTATISGPTLPAPKSVLLTQRDQEDWNALVAYLPVGSNYVFTISATDATNTQLYTGAATGIAIIANQVTTVVIIANQVPPPPPYVLSLPVIDSLLVSSASLAPGATVTAKVTAHDTNPNSTVSFAWSTNPASQGSFSAPTAATTQWTAPSSQGDVTLIVTVTDSSGTTTSASMVVSVENANATGQAAVTVTLNTSPVVTDMLVSPTYIVLGQPVSLTVVATDAANNALTYAWTSTCTAGVFSSTNAATTTFTLPASDTHTICQFNVAVSDGQGGSASGQATLPVGAPAHVEAPVITGSVEPVTMVGPVATFSITASDPNQSAMTFAWIASGGTLSGQTDTAASSAITWTAPATGSASFTVSVVVTDGLGLSTQANFTVSPPVAPGTGGATGRGGVTGTGGTTGVGGVAGNGGVAGAGAGGSTGSGGVVGTGGTTGTGGGAGGSGGLVGTGGTTHGGAGGVGGVAGAGGATITGGAGSSGTLAGTGGLSGTGGLVGTGGTTATGGAAGSACLNPSWAVETTPTLADMTSAASGTLWTVGSLYGSFNFGPGTITSTGSSDAYLNMVSPTTGAATQSFQFGDPGSHDQTASLV
ncbi:MAG: hypothetical protein ABSB49_17930, partial [Polyangia bacterium]